MAIDSKVMFKKYFPNLRSKRYSSMLSLKDLLFYLLNADLDFI